MGYPTERIALANWERICLRKFHYTLDRVSSVVKISVEERGGEHYVKALLHPGCYHWQRPLEDEGIDVVVGTGLENWEVQPPRTLEELAQMVKGHGGRWLP